MPFPRKRSPVQFSKQEMLKLDGIRKSRTEEKRRSLRAAFLLDSRSGQSDEAIARHHHVSRSTVVLCIQKFLQFGLNAALGELPRPGKPRQLPDDAIAWVQHCACQKPKELGYSYELWTAGRTATAQDSILRGEKGPGLRNQNGHRASRVQGGRNRQ